MYRKYADAESRKHNQLLMIPSGSLKGNLLHSKNFASRTPQQFSPINKEDVQIVALAFLVTLS